MKRYLYIRRKKRKTARSIVEIINDKELKYLFDYYPSLKQWIKEPEPNIPYGYTIEEIYGKQYINCKYIIRQYDTLDKLFIKYPELMLL